MIAKRPKTINEIILNKTTPNTVLVERFKEGEAKSLGSIFNRMNVNIRQSIENLPKSLRGKKQLAKSLSAIREDLQSFLKDARQVLRSDLRVFAEIEAKRTANLMTQVQGTRFKAGTPGPLGDVRGRSLSQWFANQQRVVSAKLAEQIRIGLGSGETKRQIRGRINQVLSTNKRQMQALTRTAVKQASIRAKQATFEVNSNKLQGVQWISQLDARTSEICISLDGRIFPVNEGERPPAHHQCRSDIVPVFRGVEPAKVQTYPTWLKNQTVKVQNEVLGVGKAKLWRAGRLDIREFNGVGDRPLTLEQISVRSRE